MSTQFIPEIHSHVAAAERVLVERGLGEEYGVALFDLMYPATGRGRQVPGWKLWVAESATAPLDVRLRAMAACIRNEQAK